VAVLKVPDARVEKLAEFHKPKKITYAEFQFIDIAPNEAAGEEKARFVAGQTIMRVREKLGF